MQSIQKTITAAVLAVALSQSMAGIALADDASTPDTAGASMLATGRTPNEVRDTLITTNVNSALDEEATQGADIKVETVNGVVSLSGTVPNRPALETVVEKAKAVEGVRDVSASGLEVAN